MSKKLKVLVLSWEYYPIIVGGLAMLIQSAVEELINQGVEVDVALPFIPKDFDGDKRVSWILNMDKDIKKYLKKDLTIDGLDFDYDHFSAPKKNNLAIPPLFRRGKQDSYAGKIYPKNTPKKTKAYAFAIRDHLKNNHYDAIIGADWEVIPTRVLTKDSGIPFYYYINATEADRSPSSYWKNGSSRVYELEKKHFKDADKVIAISNVVSSTLQNIYDVPENKIVVVHDDIEFNPDLMGFRSISKTKNVIYIGRISAQKGLSFLVDTAKKVLNIDSHIKFFICGDGDVMRSVIDKISEYGLEKNIFITGWADHDLKKQLYRSGDIFVMPSPSEPFGLTALEAIRSGLPVISSKHCGFNEVVPSTPLFEYHDVDSFAQMILHYTNNDHNRIVLLKKQQDELMLHSWSDQVKKIVDLVKKNKK